MNLHSVAFRGMGCELTAWVAAAHGVATGARLAGVRACFAEAEAELSRFRPDSELSRLNTATGRAVRVGPRLWEVLELAVRAAERSDGLYDPTVLGALEAAGYDRPFREIVHRPAATVTAHPVAGCWRAIRLEPAARSVTLPAGARLDLGGIAKAWAAERAAEHLAGLGPCLVDAGGDIATRGGPPDEPGWPIGVADPRRPDDDLALLQIRGRGVATSGIDYRRWRVGGRSQHHLIDPRTGRPAQTDLLSATVVADDAIEANLHALVAMVLGRERGLEYLARQEGVEGLLVRRDGALCATVGFERYVERWGDGG